METIITESKDAQAQQAKERVGEITLNAAVISHRGCVRPNNEDNFFFEGDLMPDRDVNEGAAIRATVTKDYHLLAICDGMGGLQGGERASSIAIHAMNVLNQYFPNTAVGRAIDSYVDTTNHSILTDGITQGEEGKEGTTMAMLYISDGIAHIANVGDSRVYLLRLGKLYQLSVDHSPVFRMMKRGELTREQMRKHPRGNRIEAYLGIPERRKPNPFAYHFRMPVCAGDCFMLCSDGLSDLLMHDEIQKRMMEASDPMAGVAQLIWRAMEQGGKDNTTCIIAEASGAGLPQPTPASVKILPQEK